MGKEQGNKVWRVGYVEDSYFYHDGMLLGIYRTEEEANEAAEKAKVEFAEELEESSEIQCNYIQITSGTLDDQLCWKPRDGQKASCPSCGAVFELRQILDK